MFSAKVKKDCSTNEELLYIENFLKYSSGWLQIVFFFHSGTEHWQEQLKNTLYDGNEDDDDPDDDDPDDDDDDDLNDSDDQG